MANNMEWYGDQVIRSVEAAKQGALTGAALVVEGAAKVLSPIDTGNLRSSITHEILTDEARVGLNTEYAPYQEYGFRHWKSGKFIQNPFLRPALDRNEARVKKMIGDVLGKAAEAGGR